MYVNVFDDERGTVGHLIAGGITYFLPVMFVVFMMYELIEHIYLNGAEKEANYIGDVLEYSVGIMMATVMIGILGCIGIIVFIGFVAGITYCMRQWNKERGECDE